MCRLLPGLALAMLWACGDRPPAEAVHAPAARLTDAGTVLHRGNGPEPATLDPQRAQGTPEYSIIRDLYEGLLTESPQADLVAGAAERWTVAEEGRRYTFVLREGLRWSDGTALTAADFAAGLRRAVDPATASPNAFLLEPVRGAAEIIAGRAPIDSLGVSAENERTLVIELTAPAAHFLAVLAHPVSSPARSGTDLGNGAYRLAERRPHEYVRLERNPWYRDPGSVAIAVVYHHAVDETAAEVNLYRAGQLDLTSEIPNSAYEWIRREFGDELKVAPYLSTYGYALNITRPPFAGAVALRQALSLIVDREALVERVTGVGERAAYGWVPPGVSGYEPQTYDWRDWTDERRLAEARRLYSQAGFGAHAQAKVELRYDASPNHARNALALAGMWKKAFGLEIELIEQEWKVFLDLRRDLTRGGMTRLGWVGDYNDALTFLEVFASDHPQNVTGYADPDYDGLIEAAARELDPARRRRLLARAERRLLDAYVVMPLYFNVSKHLVKPYVEGFVPHVMNHHDSRHLRLRRVPDLTN